MRSFAPVVVVALVVVAGGRAQVTIDNPKAVTLALTNGRQTFGEVTGVTAAGIAFRADGANAALTQSWDLIRVARTKAADYTPGAKAGTLVRTDPPADPGGILPRVIGPHAATVRFEVGKVEQGTVLCVLPDEIGFQAEGKTTGLTFPANEVLRVELADAVYAWNPKTKRLEKTKDRPVVTTPPDPPTTKRKDTPPPTTKTDPPPPTTKTDPPPTPPGPNGPDQQVPQQLVGMLQQLVATVIAVVVLIVLAVVLLKIFKATIKFILIVLLTAILCAMLFGCIGGLFGQHGAAIGASIGFVLGAISGFLAALGFR